MPGKAFSYNISSLRKSGKVKSSQERLNEYFLFNCVEFHQFEKKIKACIQSQIAIIMCT